jgi:hypothetical protein
MSVMTVKELIKELSDMPQDVTVKVCIGGLELFRLIEGVVDNTQDVDGSKKGYVSIEAHVAELPMEFD